MLPRSESRQPIETTRSGRVVREDVIYCRLFDHRSAITFQGLQRCLDFSELVHYFTQRLAICLSAKANSLPTSSPCSSIRYALWALKSLAAEPPFYQQPQTWMGRNLSKALRF